MKNVIILIALLLGTWSIGSGKSETPKLIIPEGYEVVYDANNKPYFVESQTTLEGLVKENKVTFREEKSIFIEPSLICFKTYDKCYVWDSKKIGYEYDTYYYLGNIHSLETKKRVYEFLNYRGYNIFSILNKIVIGAVELLFIILEMLKGGVSIGEISNEISIFFLVLVCIFSFIITYYLESSEN